MGQALRRATGRVRVSGHRPPPVEAVKRADRPPPVGPAMTEAPATAGQDHVGISDPESIPGITNEQGVLEERDPGYDAMLSKMVGRITVKPGGKLEMGEAYIVEKYNRPMPKLRSSKAEVEGDEQKSAPPGTLTAAQLQEIILLHQGKSELHQGPMVVPDIAKRFRIDAAHVEGIVQFISIPPENNTTITKK